MRVNPELSPPIALPVISLHLKYMPDTDIAFKDDVVTRHPIPELSSFRRGAVPATFSVVLVAFPFTAII